MPSVVHSRLQSSDFRLQKTECTGHPSGSHSIHKQVDHCEPDLYLPAQQDLRVTPHTRAQTFQGLPTVADVITSQFPTRQTPSELASQWRRGEKQPAKILNTDISSINSPTNQTKWVVLQLLRHTWDGGVPSAPYHRRESPHTPCLRGPSVL